MSDTPEEKKRGRKEGYRKANAMKGRVSIRVPQELEDWLTAEGEIRGLGAGDMARMLLMEIWHARR